MARIMRAFADRPIAEITSAEIERFLRSLDRQGLTGRNVNANRQLLANVFEYATRPDAFALPVNPVRAVDKRREDYSKPPETFTAEQVMALARAAREGKHVSGGRRWASQEEDFEQPRFNRQDAAIYTVAGFTGLRQGELRALRWRHVRFADRTLVVVAGISAGYESTTKSGKWRAVPLTREAFVALDELSQREWFTGPTTTSSAAPPATRSKTPRCAAATTPLAMPPDSRSCRSTTCVTRSRRSRSAASIPPPSRRCSGTRRSRPPSATCTRGL